jgi:hypothetical protein
LSATAAPSATTGLTGSTGLPDKSIVFHGGLGPGFCPGICFRRKGSSLDESSLNQKKGLWANPAGPEGGLDADGRPGGPN